MNDSPRRIQRKRTKGWRMPPNTVYVGRPTQWGNPFAAARTLGADWFGLGEDHMVATAAEAVSLYRRWLGDCAARGVPLPIPSLRGKNLACWCAPGAWCHADVLLELANGEPPRGVNARPGRDMRAGEP